MAQGKFTTSPTPQALTNMVNGLVDDIAGKAASSHTHNYAASSHNHSATNITSGTLAVAIGGTGVTANPSVLTNLGSTSAASVFAASPRPGVTGTLAIANGGTGATTVAGARNNLGLGNTNGALPIANGGTGATTVKQARTNLGIDIDVDLSEATLLWEKANPTSSMGGSQAINLSQPYTNFKKILFIGSYDDPEYFGFLVVNVDIFQQMIELAKSINYGYIATRCGVTTGFLWKIANTTTQSLYYDGQSTARLQKIYGYK